MISDDNGIRKARVTRHNLVLTHYKTVQSSDQLHHGVLSTDTYDHIVCTGYGMARQVLGSSNGVAAHIRDMDPDAVASILRDVLIPGYKEITKRSGLSADDTVDLIPPDLRDIMDFECLGPYDNEVPGHALQLYLCDLGECGGMSRVEGQSPRYSVMV